MQPALERIGCVMVGRILQRSTHGFVFLVMKAGGYRAGLLVLARRAQAREEALDAGAIARQHQTLRGARGQRALPRRQPLLALQVTLSAAAQVLLDRLALLRAHPALAPQRPRHRHRPPRALARLHPRVAIRRIRQLIRVRARVVARTAVAQHRRRRREATEEIQRLARRRRVQRLRSRHLRRYHRLHVLWPAILQRASRGHARRVQHAVQPAPARANRLHHPAQRILVGHLGREIRRVRRAMRAQLVEQRVDLAIPRATPDQRQARVAAPRQMPGEQASQATRAARDQVHAALAQIRRSRRRRHRAPAQRLAPARALAQHIRAARLAPDPNHRLRIGQAALAEQHRRS